MDTFQIVPSTVHCAGMLQSVMSAQLGSTSHQMLSVNVSSEQNSCQSIDRYLLFSILFFINHCIEYTTPYEYLIHVNDMFQLAHSIALSAGMTHNVMTAPKVIS